MIINNYIKSGNDDVKHYGMPEKIIKKTELTKQYEACGICVRLDVESAVSSIRQAISHL